MTVCGGQRLTGVDRLLYKLRNHKASRQDKQLNKDSMQPRLTLPEPPVVGGDVSRDEA